MTQFVPIGVALVLCMLAGITDIRSLRIYNWLTVPALLSGMIFQFAMHGAAGLTDSLAGVLISFAVLLVPFMIGAMGAGDVKLMSALGAWVGGLFASQIILVACLLTGVASVIAILRRGGIRAAWLNVRISWYRLQTLKHHLVMDEPDELRAMQSDPERKSDLIPFSIMLLLAVLLVLLVQMHNSSAFATLSSLALKIWSPS
ncbi:MAG: prepilin peptidase [Pirellulaceae bacterium]|nr:prepilin peptidase [Pirellulaceae bacterium]